jgi:hypothetical protein
VAAGRASRLPAQLRLRAARRHTERINRRQGGLGWNLLFTWWLAADVINPAVHFVTSKIEQNPDLQTLIDPLGTQGWLRPNCIHPPFDNKKNGSDHPSDA